MTLPTASPPSAQAQVRAARVAVSAVFLANGALFANIVPRVPQLKAELALSNSALGLALAAASVGALLAGAAASPLIRRLGSGRLAVGTCVLAGAVLVLFGVAPGWAVLALAFFLFGALDAVMDVAMNAHALRVQQRYGRSVINGFHAWWSIGAALGAATGALAASVDLPVVVHLSLAGGLLAAGCLLASRWLLPGPEDEPDAQAGTEAAADGAVRGGRQLSVLRALGLLAVLATLGAIAEDVPGSWGTLYLREELGASPGTAGAGYLCFAAAMTVGRLVNDRLVARWGEAAVLRAGMTVSALGLGAALVIGRVPVALAGLAAAGFGVSSLFPAFFTAAAGRARAMGRSTADGVAVVSWIARAGFLVAPVLVGTVADAFGLAWGVGLACLAAASVAMLAGAVRPRVGEDSGGKPIDQRTGPRPG